MPHQEDFGILSYYLERIIHRSYGHDITASRADLVVMQLDTRKHLNMLVAPTTVIKPIGNADSFEVAAYCVMLTSGFPVYCFRFSALLAALHRVLEEEPGLDGECVAMAFVPYLLEHPCHPCAVGCYQSRSKALRC